MIISVFTPHHAVNNEFIQECWHSLKTQSFTDFEWVTVLNNGGKLPEEAEKDARTKIIRLPDGATHNVGFLKKLACDNAKGDVVFELDSDDKLLPDALFECAKAFNDDSPDFVYSECVEVKQDWSTVMYSPYYGWKHAEATVDGKTIPYCRAFPPSVHALRLIYWSPNHFRAWKKSFYDEIGGHNAAFSTCDDHDIMCRTYINGKLKLIQKPLYFQRVHDKNTQKTRNAEIQRLTRELYQKYIWQMAEKWCDDNKLLKIDLGSALGPARPGYLTVDRRGGCNIKADLNEKWPFMDGEVGIIRAFDFIEHVKDQVHLMNEAWRCLAPGGWFMISVPSTDGRGAFQDPTHVSFWNQNSFWYYTRSQQAKFVPEFIGRFQTSILETGFPSKWHEENKISYVNAHLIAMKPGYDPVGEHLFRD